MSPDLRRPRIPVGSVRSVLAIVAVLWAAQAGAQNAVLGPNKCVGCHDHEQQKTQWSVTEPGKLQDKAHYRTRKQLEGPKAAGYAQAIGLADPAAPTGACAKCHGTVAKGALTAGVSCESCHGPGSGYLDIHQAANSHPASVAAGMLDLRGKVPSIAKLCISCHYTLDARLAKAGHPSGSNFDAGSNLKQIVHWKTTYDYAAVTKAGLAFPRPGGGAPPAAAAPAAGAKPAAGAPPAAPPANPPAGGAPPPAAPAAAGPDPWVTGDIPALPANYGLPGASTPTSRPVLRRSLVEDPPQGAPTAAIAPAAPKESEAAPAAPAQRPAAAAAAEVRGKGVSVLEELLKKKARVPGLAKPAPPGEYKGPDGELLRLQDEVLALALEALRRPE